MALLSLAFFYIILSKQSYFYRLNRRPYCTGIDLGHRFSSHAGYLAQDYISTATPLTRPHTDAKFSLQFIKRVVSHGYPFSDFLYIDFFAATHDSSF